MYLFVVFGLIMWLHDQNITNTTNKAWILFPKLQNILEQPSKTLQILQTKHGSCFLSFKTFWNSPPSSNWEIIYAFSPPWRTHLKQFHFHQSCLFSLISSLLVRFHKPEPKPLASDPFITLILLHEEMNILQNHKQNTSKYQNTTIYSKLRERERDLLPWNISHQHPIPIFIFISWYILRSTVPVLWQFSNGKAFEHVP